MKALSLDSDLVAKFPVTEAIATKGGSVTTFEQYRSILTQIYLSLSLAVLFLLALYTFVVIAV
jgi:hypothetical protein